jgi:type VI secretion system secreted protein Hcp
MAVDMVLELDGINGESSILKNAIDIHSWSFGMNQTGTGHTATGSGAGKVAVQDINVMKNADKVSPTLMLKCCGGDHIKKGKITCRKAGGKPLDYYVIEIEDILITSVQTQGSNGGDLVSESLSLNFTKFKVIYTPQKADGSADGKVDMGWDISTNKKQ